MAERARQLHTRYRAFMKGEFEAITSQESKREGSGHPKSTGTKEQTRPIRLNQQKKLG